MIAVVIPCYKVSRHIVDVIAAIGDEVTAIVVIDDCCPEASGKLVASSCDDPRVHVIYNAVNLGVGGAVMEGYRYAMNLGVEAIVKIDGDGQMDPRLIASFAEPILNGKADYLKGNRFYDVEVVRRMPAVRLVGNIMLSFLTKLSSGYWPLFDPTNGYTCISAKVVRFLPLDKIAKGYFFETDMLFRLNILRAVVVDMPMTAKYEDETSNLSITREVPVFLVKNLSNYSKRIFYNYFLRNFSYASFELIIGLSLSLFGLVFGGVNWIEHWRIESYASAGTVMLSGLTMILGVQMLLGFLQYDISNQPVTPFQNRITPDLDVPGE